MKFGQVLECYMTTIFARQSCFWLNAGDLTQSKEIQRNWTRLQKLKNLILLFFDDFSQTLISGRKTGGLFNFWKDVSSQIWHFLIS